VLQPKIAKKITKDPYFGSSRSFKVIDLDVNQKGVWDFLLVVNSNLSPILHRFWDTATYWLKIANCLYPLSFCALDLGDPFRISEKATILKLESSWQSMVRFRDLSLHHFDTIAECDRQTDATTMAKTREALHAVERKNCSILGEDINKVQ